MGCFLVAAVLLFSLVAAVSTQFNQVETYDYCDPKLKLCEVFTDHTMCKYPVPGLAPQCTPAVHEPLSATEKKRILFWHNKFRSNVANVTERNKNRKLPTSSNMRQIYWDKELEAIAARWAEQCVSSNTTKVYDKCRNTKRFQVSQNVGSRRVNGTSIEKQAPQIIITWYKESKDFDPALVDKFIPVGDDKMSAKQFANIIWADTYAIGCARVIFQEQLPISDKDPKKTSVWTIERLVCNYGPGGNEIGKPVYKRGASCENCPNGTQCSVVFPGLCAIQNAEKLEGQQNLENQDSKEDATTESEMSTPEAEANSESSVEKSKEKDESQTREESVPEDEKNDRLYPPMEGYPGEGDESENGAGATEDCEGDDCYHSSSSTSSGFLDRGRYYNEILKSPKATARKKSDGVEKKVPGDVVYYGKQKWTVAKSVRDVGHKAGRRKMENGDSCNCYEPLDDDESGSSRTQYNFYTNLCLLLYYSTKFFILYCSF